MGAVLQQRVNNTWQPLAFFSRKLNPAQHKYSAYDRESLAICEAVKHFRHMLEARHFVISTDHKPISSGSPMWGCLYRYARRHSRKCIAKSLTGRFLRWSTNGAAGAETVRRVLEELAGRVAA
jgi:hypothetical protein